MKCDGLCWLLCTVVYTVTRVYSCTWRLHFFVPNSFSILWNVCFILLYIHTKNFDRSHQWIISLSKSFYIFFVTLDHMTLLLLSGGYMFISHHISGIDIPRNTYNVPFLHTLCSTLHDLYFSSYDIIYFVSMRIFKNITLMHELIL